LRPRDELERRVAELWEEVLGTRGIGISDSFFDMGGHSLLAVRLLARVRKTFQRDLPLAVLFQDPTVAGMAGFLRKNAPPPPWSSLVVLQPAGWRPPLFIATGGAAMLYRSIAQHLAPDQPVYGLQGEDIFGNRTDYPGVEEIARAYIEEMRQVAPEGPYHLAGWSFGGMIAFEMACQLREMGEEVAHLGLIEAYAPGYPRFPALPGRLLWHAGNVLRMKPDARRVYLRDRFKGAASMLRRNLFYVARKSVRRLDTPLPTGLRNSVWTADLQAADYQPRVYTGRIDLFRAEVQPEGCKTDPYLGWGSLAERIQVWECPGRHGNIGLEPNVAHLAQAIRQALDTTSGAPAA
jgi:thioesterase domain-containing protein